ncbi:MAG: hypothetical protein J6Z06_08715, partial [Lachnospiraceae bacterium]|nr:hypothetical protein [Lachnospiraceae bacterium]
YNADCCGHYQCKTGRNHNNCAHHVSVSFHNVPFRLPPAIQIKQKKQGQCALAIKLNQVNDATG